MGTEQPVFESSTEFDEERPARLTGNGREQRTSRERPETFDFLGFTHHWDVSRQRRWYVLCPA